MKQRLLIAVLVASAFAGCREPTTARGHYEGQYALESIAGEPLPAVAVESANETTRILSETIVLRSDGTGTITTSRQIERTGSSPLLETVEETLLFWIVDDHIELAPLCPGLCSAFYRPPWIARLANGTLRIERHYFYRVPLTYQRQ
jgi:hypothetical protein